MSIYINTVTGEYPRHEGDIAVRSAESWAQVIPTTPEKNPDSGKVWAEDIPEIKDGQYFQKWKQVNAPVPSIIFDFRRDLYPNDGNKYQWNESTRSWDIVD